MNVQMYDEVLHKFSIGQSEYAKYLLDLAEKQDPEIYEVIWCLLEHPVFANNKGTLIYALHNYPAEPIFPQAIDWVLTGVYEVAWMAMDIIMNVESVNLDVYLAAEKKIQLMLTTKDLVDWREEFLLEILNIMLLSPEFCWLLLVLFYLRYLFTFYFNCFKNIIGYIRYVNLRIYLHKPRTLF